MKFPQHILLLFLTIVLISCKDEKSVTPTNMVFEMPPYTDTGANVLAYKANGVVYRSFDYSGLSDGVEAARYRDVDHSEKGFILYIEGKSIEKNIYHSVKITIQNVVDTGRYFLNKWTSPNENEGVFKVGKNESVFTFYKTLEVQAGYVDITKLDTVNKIVAGRFSFVARFDDFGTPSIDSFTITNGQFDLIYYQ